MVGGGGSGAAARPPKVCMGLSSMLLCLVADPAPGPGPAASAEVQDTWPAAWVMRWGEGDRVLLLVGLLGRDGGWDAGGGSACEGGGEGANLSSGVVETAQRT